MTFMITSTGREHHLAGIGQQLNAPAIEEIAHSLAQINRFTGHARRPYSVAEHSLLVAGIAADEGASPISQLAALLHDAHEAYVGDMASPAKWAIGHPWEVFEHHHEQALHNALGLRSVMSSQRAHLKRWDLMALATERRDLTSFNPATSTHWRILDPPGQEVRPIAINLMAEARADMRWTDWLQVFTEHHDRLQRQVSA